MISQYLSADVMEDITAELFNEIHEKVDSVADALDIPLNAIDYDFAAGDVSYIFLRKDMTTQEQAEDLANMLSTAISDLTEHDFKFDNSTEEENVKDFAITFELNLNF